MDARPDVLIAGGGVAGAALAVMLGRRGVRVDLFERRRYPADKPCGEGILPGGVGVLARLGLLEAVGGEPFHALVWHAGDRAVEARFRGQPAFGLAQRRLRLDEALFAAARRTPGVRTFEGVRVRAPLVEDGRVVGLLADAPRRAPLVVVADGAASPLRQALGLSAPPPLPARLGLRAHFGPVPEAPRGVVEVFLADGHELYTTRLPGGEVLVAALSDRLAVGVDLRAALFRWIAAEPRLRDRLAGAPLLGAVAGRYPLTVRALRGLVPGAVLLGDAAGSTDPVTGGGMAQALLAAELLADHVPFYLAHGDAALARFDRRRRRLLRPQRLLTRAALALVAHPRLAHAALGAIEGSPALLSRLAGVAAGTERVASRALSAR
jgi:2-polyprenyl-6-methoxyphenol hydroxylase-like FAD-dependent oxidoreductase